eukprot:m.29499 g.29499  ORF g.29499 m.29499 type:complete len:70 (+) comp9171_c0_seq2:2046-2255(+)
MCLALMCVSVVYLSCVSSASATIQSQRYASSENVKSAKTIEIQDKQASAHHDQNARNQIIVCLVCHTCC